VQGLELCRVLLRAKSFRHENLTYNLDLSAKTVGLLKAKEGLLKGQNPAMKKGGRKRSGSKQGGEISVDTH